MKANFGDLITISIPTDIGELDAPAFYIADNPDGNHIVMTKTEDVPCWKDSIICVDGEMKFVKVICRLIEA